MMLKSLTRRVLILLVGLGLASATLFSIGCDGDSSESIVRNVTLLVSGFYQNGGNPIPQNQTGNPVTSLNLAQSGDQLSAKDNNGHLFKGSIGRATESEASFTLTGKTTAGQDVTISGTIKVAVDSTEGVMQGTWLEPSIAAPLFARATVPQNTQITNNNSSTTNGSGSATNGNSSSTNSSSTTTNGDDSVEVNFVTQLPPTTFDFSRIW